MLSIVFFAALAASPAMTKPYTDKSVDLRGDWGQLAFDVTLADTPEKRAFGLLHVEHLPKRSGILFIYPREAKGTFWMKNTLTPFDILFFDAGEI